MTDIMQFINDLYMNQSWSDEPQLMTEEEAAYNLRQYRAEKREIPAGLTPALFASLWNSYVYTYADLPF